MQAVHGGLWPAGAFCGQCERGVLGNNGVSTRASCGKSFSRPSLYWGSTQADVLFFTGSAYLLHHSGFFNEQRELVGLMVIRNELAAEVELNLKAYNHKNDWVVSLCDRCEALSVDLWEEC